MPATTRDRHARSTANFTCYYCHGNQKCDQCDGHPDNECWQCQDFADEACANHPFCYQCRDKAMWAEGCQNCLNLVIQNGVPRNLPPPPRELETAVISDNTDTVVTMESAPPAIVTNQRGTDPRLAEWVSGRGRVRVIRRTVADLFDTALVNTVATQLSNLARAISRGFVQCARLKTQMAMSDVFTAILTYLGYRIAPHLVGLRRNHSLPVPERARHRMLGAVGKKKVESLRTMCDNLDASFISEVEMNKLYSDRLKESREIVGLVAIAVERVLSVQAGEGTSNCHVFVFGTFDETNAENCEKFLLVSADTEAYSVIEKVILPPSCITNITRVDVSRLDSKLEAEYGIPAYDLINSAPLFLVDDMEQVSLKAHLWVNFFLNEPMDEQVAAIFQEPDGSFDWQSEIGRRVELYRQGSEGIAQAVEDAQPGVKFTVGSYRDESIPTEVQETQDQPAQEEGVRAENTDPIVVGEQETSAPQDISILEMESTVEEPVAIPAQPEIPENAKRAFKMISRWLDEGRKKAVELREYIEQAEDERDITCDDPDLFEQVTSDLIDVTDTLHYAQSAIKEYLNTGKVEGCDDDDDNKETPEPPKQQQQETKTNKPQQNKKRKIL